MCFYILIGNALIEASELDLNKDSKKETLNEQTSLSAESIESSFMMVTEGVKERTKKPKEVKLKPQIIDSYP